MRASRFLVGSLSSFVWPAVVLLAPIGITFAAARVYAESGPPVPDCDSGVVIECQGKAQLDRCTGCGTADCVCSQQFCSTGSGPFPEAVLCAPAAACATPFFQSCAGKAPNEPCEVDAKRGRCGSAELSCLVPDGGAGWSKVERIGCIVPPNTSSSSSSSSGSESSSSSSSSSGAGGGPVPENNDSGCASSPGTATGIAGLVGAPLAIGLLLARRRRQPRKAPSARKRS